MTTSKSPDAKVNNGVNVTALLDARGALEKAPAAAQFKWRASCEWLKGTHSRSTIGNYFGLGAEQSRNKTFAVEADHPPVFAAEDNAPTPVELVLSGLASCLTAGVAAVAQRRGIQLHSVKASLEADMDIQGILGIDDEVRNGFGGIRVHFDIRADASEDDIKALVAQSQKRSGIQLAREIQAAGRRVVLSVGEHVRMPRTYRGRDIQWWMDAMGAMDVRYDAVEDIERARRLPSLQLVGTPARVTIDLNSLRKAGVELVGRLVGLRDGKAQFSGSLANHCALADLKMNRLLASIDDWVNTNGIAERFPAPHRYEPTDVGTDTRLSLGLDDGKIRTVIWATGYRPDYSWLDMDALDRKGRIRHEGGVVPVPGMYVMGLPFMRRRKSSFIDGAGDDAADLATHLSQSLAGAAA